MQPALHGIFQKGISHHVTACRRACRRRVSPLGFNPSLMQPCACLSVQTSHKGASTGGFPEAKQYHVKPVAPEPRWCMMSLRPHRSVHMLSCDWNPHYRIQSHGVSQLLHRASTESRCGAYSIESACIMKLKYVFKWSQTITTQRPAGNSKGSSTSQRTTMENVQQAGGGQHNE